MLPPAAAGFAYIVLGKRRAAFRDLCRSLAAHGLALCAGDAPHSGQLYDANSRTTLWVSRAISDPSLILPQDDPLRLVVWYRVTARVMAKRRLERALLEYWDSEDHGARAKASDNCRRICVCLFAKRSNR